MQMSNGVAYRNIIAIKVSSIAKRSGDLQALLKLLQEDLEKCTEIGRV